VDPLTPEWPPLNLRSDPSMGIILISRWRDDGGRLPATMTRSTRLAIGLVAVALLLSGCGSTPSTAGEGESVVASFYPLAEAASKVGGDLVSVQNLTPPGVEPHDLELAPDDIEAIANAGVIVYLGGGFQPAVEDALAEAEHAVTVDALNAVAPNAAPASGAEGGVTVDP